MVHSFSVISILFRLESTEAREGLNPERQLHLVHDWRNRRTTAGLF